MTTTSARPAELQRSLDNLKLERDAVMLYEGLAAIDKDPVRADAFHAIAAGERRHAFVWATRVNAAGGDVPPKTEPRWRVRAILVLARLFGTKAVSGMVKALEGDELALYEGLDGLEMKAIAADEREHAAIWKRLDMGMPGVEPSTPEAVAAAEIAIRDESWHRAAGNSGTLRAAVFGINDGLVSNLALIMGFAGASSDNSIIVLSGVAGLLAGAFSMAAGEYISMQSQKELFERQIELEREELRFMPEKERDELAALYRTKGLSHEEAEMVSSRLMQDPEKALDTKIREELGLDPDELGSPWGAAGSSFAAFALGAIIPLVPFLLTSGTAAIAISASLALVALFVVGALVSLLTGRSLVFSGLRQCFIGGGTALVTFIVGSIIGVSVA
ncbi:MAG: VIT1/CCC1 transporter family protein [Candidatus Limnocylindrales bacterium]